MGGKRKTCLPPARSHCSAEEYFGASPPKSCGRDEFNLRLAGATSTVPAKTPEDVQATLLELTAVSIAEAMASWCGKPRTLLVCGGGGRNHALMERLRNCWATCSVELTDAVGQPADWVEAVAFAWLAWRTPARTIRQPARSYRHGTRKRTGRDLSAAKNKKAPGRFRRLSSGIRSGRERGTAAAGTGGVGILDHELGALQAFGVVDFGTNEILVAHRIDQ
jgi:hypothetical protein